MLCESCKSIVYKRLARAAAAVGVALVAAGGAALLEARPSAPAAVPPPPPQQLVDFGASHAVHAGKRPVRHAAQRAVRPRKAAPTVAATVSLYEHTVAPSVLRQQGCRSGRRGAGGVVILAFGQPAYNGHTYGTMLFSGRFAGNKRITRALLAYATGYVRCLARGSHASITLARGTSNYHPQVPNTYRAGRRWAHETMVLSDLLRAYGLAAHVTSAAADDVEPAWDRSFQRTRDFFRGYRDARPGHVLYNFGSLDGGVGRVWNAGQMFFVASGMTYVRAIPQIYNHAMAREWATLAHFARRRFHRPLRFAGVLTERTAQNHAMKPLQARHTLVRELAARVGPDAPDVPLNATNIRSAQ